MLSTHNSVVGRTQRSFYRTRIQIYENIENPWEDSQNPCVGYVADCGALLPTEPVGRSLRGNSRGLLRRRPSRWALARVSAAMHALPRPPHAGPPQCMVRGTIHGMARATAAGGGAKHARPTPTTNRPVPQCAPKHATVPSAAPEHHAHSPPHMRARARRRHTSAHIMQTPQARARHPSWRRLKHGLGPQGVRVACPASGLRIPCARRAHR